MRVSAILLAFLLGLTVTACTRSDTETQADLQQQLAADPLTASVTATVKDGNARLSGVTAAKEQQDRAIAIARAVKGVRNVEPAMRMDDAALADAVRKKIAADASVSAIPLRIEVHEGEVKLFSDRTNADQRAALADIARSVYGVSHVEDNMR
jgi:osmotically-inducible protein OsmY